MKSVGERDKRKSFDPIRPAARTARAVSSHKLSGAIEFLLKNWPNDGAEGESVHLVANELWLRLALDSFFECLVTNHSVGLLSRAFDLVSRFQTDNVIGLLKDTPGNARSIFMLEARGLMVFTGMAVNIDGDDGKEREAYMPTALGVKLLLWLGEIDSTEVARFEAAVERLRSKGLLTEMNELEASASTEGG